ncbi:MAG: response regulator [Deltaproteobacteria bacterium]|nr:response regulator [Deltaproteobacteria bacterium]
MSFDKITKILVVDDTEFMRTLIDIQLRSRGASNILQAKDGSEALRILRQEPVDIVLSDWNMPVMTGLELLNAIRTDAKLCHLPFVMITAETERDRIAEAISQGVSDLLVKPYTSAHLIERIERAMSRKSQKIMADTPDASTEKVSDPCIPDMLIPFKKTSVPVAKKSLLPTILVVDDTPDFLHYISHLFKDEYSVRISHTGEKALGICQSDNPPDLVLLDIMMPGMDGFEVARQMREHPMSETIPVIFVTAMTGDDARMRGLELGAVDFVTKPIDPEVLKPRVRNFLRYVELRKQLQSDYDAMLENARLREDVEHITRHDLKCPLAGMIGLVQALAEDGSINREQSEQLRLVEETALQVLNMINLSSELYKIETGRFHLDAQPVNVADILGRVVDIFRRTFSEKRLTVSISPDAASMGESPPQSLGDAMLCYSLFQNLIKNACEAAPENSRVAIALNDGDPLRITIQNNGVVPSEIRDRFFDKFVTLGKPGGTGLGTYSAKLLIEAQNGRISLDVSDEENLSTITVSLPRFTGGIGM